MVRKIGLQLGTAGIIGELPADGCHGLRDRLDFLVVDFLRRVGGPVIIDVQPDGEERDGDSHLGEIVMVAAVEDALAVGLRPEVIVGGIRRGHIVKVIDLEFLIAGVGGVDGLS